MSREGRKSGMQDTNIEPSRGVVGLIQQNTEGGRCLIENASAHKDTFVVVVVSCCSGFMVGQTCC